MEEVYYIILCYIKLYYIILTYISLSKLLEKHILCKFVNEKQRINYNDNNNNNNNNNNIYVYISNYVIFYYINKRSRISSNT